MLSSHARLFRDYGLNATHFDHVASCLVNSLNKLEVPTEIVNEIVSILVPLRPVFDQGSEMAKKEKETGTIEFLSLGTVKDNLFA